MRLMRIQVPLSYVGSGFIEELGKLNDELTRALSDPDRVLSGLYDKSLEPYSREKNPFPGQEKREASR
jgi:hypothetical protein